MEIPSAKLTGISSPLTVTVNPNVRFIIGSSGRTLSWTIDLKLDGSTFQNGTDYGVLSFYTNSDTNGVPVANVPISSTGDWSVTLPGNIEGTLYARVVMPSASSGVSLKLDTSYDLSGAGSWDMGTRSFVSLSGTVNISVNGSSFSPGGDDAASISSYYDTALTANQYNTSAPVGSDGAWRLIFPEVTGPRTVSLRLSLQMSGQSYPEKKNIWQGEVNDSPVTAGSLSVVIKTLSGSLGNITVNGDPSSGVLLGAVNSAGTGLGQARENLASGSSWNMDVGNYRGTVKFALGALRASDSLLVMRPFLASPVVTVTDGGNTGIDIGNVNIQTRTVVINVTRSGSPLPCVTGITKVPLSQEDLTDNYTFEKTVTMPYDDLPSFSTSHNLPVALGFPVNLCFLVLTTDGKLYVTASALDSSSGEVNLDIDSMAYVDYMPLN
jgi:hypothetical protein